MEKRVTIWIKDQHTVCALLREECADNCYDPFYAKVFRYRSKQAKQKLAKLVELQQSIRKQKRITRN